MVSETARYPRTHLPLDVLEVVTRPAITIRAELGVVTVNQSGDLALSSPACARRLFVIPVDYPTVPLDQARFRASVTTLHTRALLDEAPQVIEDAFVPTMRAPGRLRTGAV